MQNFAFDDVHQEKNLHCSLTVMSSSLLVLNNYNERMWKKKWQLFFRFLGILGFHSCDLTDCNFINMFILLHEKLLQLFDWLRAVVFQLNLKYLHEKITNLLRVVV